MCALLLFIHKAQVDYVLLFQGSPGFDLCGCHYFHSGGCLLPDQEAIQLGVSWWSAGLPVVLLCPLLQPRTCESIY